MFKRLGVAVCTAGLLAIVAGSLAAESKHARVLMKDECDPTTFNAVIGPGACTGHGDTTFQEFIAELTAEKSVDDWAFDPEKMDARPGTSVTARNIGGEVHSFTEVKQFGGGVVDLLNQLSGNTDLAPECFAAGAGLTFAPPGGTVASSALVAGTHHFQCCIHPWMRTTVKVGHDH